MCVRSAPTPTPRVHVGSGLTEETRHLSSCSCGVCNEGREEPSAQHLCEWLSVCVCMYVCMYQRIYISHYSPSLPSPPSLPPSTLPSPLSFPFPQQKQSQSKRQSLPRRSELLVLSTHIVPHPPTPPHTELTAVDAADKTSSH